MKRALLPKHERLLHELGENLRMARLRRNLPSEQVAERAGIARNTLIKIENGDEGVAIGSYLRVLIEHQRTQQRFGIRTGDGCGTVFRRRGKQSGTNHRRH